MNETEIDTTSLLQKVAQYALELVLLPDGEQPWPLKLSLILIGYSTIIIPCWLLLYFLRKRFNGEKTEIPEEWYWRLGRNFAIGRPEAALPKRQSSTDSAQEIIPQSQQEKNERKKMLKEIFYFVHYFTGIQLTLVAMGFLQERVITRGYPRDIPLGGNESDVIIDRFGDSQYLLLWNRIVALLVAMVVILWNIRSQPDHVPPYYKHGYTSIANTISSWCQYEALKYVSFPTQMIFKCSKIVVTMIMGTIVRRTRYSIFEYVCGGLIAVGASLFLVSSSDSGVGGKATSISGIILMIGYIFVDAFTTNWQKKLFDTKPRVSKYQMMIGVNCFSTILCFVSLLEQGTLFISTRYALTHKGFIRDVFLLSISGAFGQLYIYATIAHFGPICFAIMLTVRQIGSIILSSIYYGHPLTIYACIGLCVVFGAMFADIYRRYRIRQRNLKKKKTVRSNSTDTSASTTSTTSVTSDDVAVSSSIHSQPSTPEPQQNKL
ncbi:unnamed protein product, partial [Mesorhabditis belari]|uniref:Adenosine 3'-phospho 5'-phosphosulfate transporter 1 n=1 Tax=Mesorhabditis belari TaxID=2138241 RepID=A0AAF3EPN7_9BILA